MPARQPTLTTRLAGALAPRYERLAELATGGMGRVFRAHDTELDREVAIKVLEPERASAAAAARFAREARILARLSHPNIVPVHAAGEADGLFYYVMDLVEGDTLATRLARGPLPPADLHALAHDLLAALARAHRAGVVHRDVKPANILLADGRAMLFDFGVAHWDTSGDELTRPEDRPGTPAWMAPEQLVGAPVTPRTDVFAAGMVLHEAATLRRWDPLVAPEKGDWSGVPAWLEPALRRALATDPSARWADAQAFRAALGGRRRSGRAVGAALLAAVALVVVAAPLRNATPRLPADQLPAGDLAILPFEDGDSAPLGRRLAQLAGTRIEWYPRWAVIPTLHGFAAWDAKGAGRGGVAWYTPARHEARGSLHRRADGWVALLTVHADSGRRLHDAIEVPGSPADPLAWSHAIADSLVSRLFADEAEEFRELTRRSTRNLAAERALLLGNDAFLLDNLAEADRQYAEALRLDPGLAQAAWQRVLVGRWQREDIGEALRALLATHGERLPVVYQDLARAQLEPDLRIRQARLREIAAAHPARDLPRFLAADELFHRGALTGVPLEDALALLDSVRGTSDFIDVASLHDHAAWGHIRLGNADAAQRHLALRAAHTGPTAAAESRQRAAFVKLAWDARFRPWMASAKSRWLLWRADSATRMELGRYLRLGLWFDVPVLQRDLARALEREPRDTPLHHQGVVAGALASLALGEWEAGLAALDSAGLRQPSAADAQLQHIEWRTVPALLALVPGQQAPTWAAESLRVLLATPSTRVRAAWVLALLDSTGADHAAPHAVLHDAAAGDAGAARLDAVLHARATALAGSPAAALLLTDSLFITDSAGRLGGPFARSVAHVLRARWLGALGRHADAAASLRWHENSDFDGWPAGPPQATEVDAVIGVAARAERARVLLAAGDTARACALVARVRELWRHGDAAFREAVSAREVPACP